MDSRIIKALAARTIELGPAPFALGPWTHWHLTLDADGIAWLILDREDTSVNTLSDEVLDELSQVLTTLESNPPKGVVLRSGKASGFIAGADVNQFRGATDAVAVEAKMRDAHAIANRFAALKVPTVAVVHGYCLGGGLEIALLCKTRIAIDNARFGFPEIMLGLHPGLGGTARFTDLIDPLQAMTLMLTGKTIDARRAKALGLVAAVTQERHVRNAVKDAISGKLKSAAPGARHLLFNLGVVRRAAANRMRAEAMKRAPREHYPAPYALIDLWERYGGSRKAMLNAEVTSFAKLMVTDTAQNLIRVFFLREAMKKSAGKTPDIKHVHVIGAGAMGGDIAAWCAARGLRATLADMKPEPIAGAMKRAGRLYAKILRKPIDLRDAFDRLIPDLDGEGVGSADLIIEAVPEKIEIKQKVYAAVEPRMKPGAVLATNTSSLPLEELAKELKAPERLVGLHFFNPVSRMQLVEVVSHEGVSDEMFARAKGFVGAIDRLPLAVKSAPGFLVNRALMPYMLEAMVMLDEQTPKEVIDLAAERFGMPMGPLELGDQVGLDICLDVAVSLRSRLPQPMPEPPQWLRDKVAAKELGRKTGKGLYVWSDGKPLKARNVSESDDPDRTDRLILPMLNVCVTCLREGIVASADEIDGAMIFGIGFAPFRGGPLRYARARGTDDIVKTLERLAAKYGPRFAPDAGWRTVF